MYYDENAIYEVENESEEDLYHHGILGQKWGHRNGPPYPLHASAHSPSEKSAGYKKSLGGGRNTGLYERNRTKSSGKSRVSNANKSSGRITKQGSSTKRKGLTDRQKKIARNVAIGAGIAAATAGGIYLYKSGKGKAALAAGKKFASNMKTAQGRFDNRQATRRAITSIKGGAHKLKNKAATGIKNAPGSAKNAIVNGTAKPRKYLSNLKTAQGRFDNRQATRKAITNIKGNAHKLKNRAVTGAGNAAKNAKIGAKNAVINAKTNVVTAGSNVKNNAQKALAQEKKYANMIKTTAGRDSIARQQKMLESQIAGKVSRLEKMRANGNANPNAIKNLSKELKANRKELSKLNSLTKYASSKDKVTAAAKNIGERASTAKTVAGHNARLAKNIAANRIKDTAKMTKNKVVNTASKMKTKSEINNTLRNFAKTEEEIRKARNGKIKKAAIMGTAAVAGAAAGGAAEMAIRNSKKNKVNKQSGMLNKKERTNKWDNAKITIPSNVSATTKKVMQDFNNMTDQEFKNKYSGSKSLYAYRVEKYGDPYMNSPYAKAGKKLNKSKVTKAYKNYLYKSPAAKAGINKRKNK